MLEVKNINKIYKIGDNVTTALDNVSLSFRKVEFVSVLGPSGSGKTTLLNILGGLDKYSSGDLIINGTSTKNFSDSMWDSYRNKSVGFIFQSYNLISHINVLSNVEMALTLSNVSKSERRSRATEVLKSVGLEKEMYKRPNELSGGQMQRVAIARALINNPDIILADEPTGALDSVTSKQIMNLIKEISKEKLVIMVTHNEALASEYSNRIIKLSDGKIINDSNPYNDVEINKDYYLKKTKMSFITALSLSLNNLKTKKGRTILTSFAASIGIIGISLVLALSNGFQKQIDNFEYTTLSSMPIFINNGADGTLESSLDAVNEQTREEYTSEKKVYSYTSDTTDVHKNTITNDYVEYVKKIDTNLINGLSYSYSVNMNMLVKDTNDKILYLNNNYFSTYPTDNNGNISTFIKDNYDLLEGVYPTSKYDVLLEIDSLNEIYEYLYKSLGLTGEDTNFSDIIGKEIKIVNNNDYYSKQGTLYSTNIYNDTLYNNENNITLKIVGIIRGREDNDISTLNGGSTLYYNYTIMEEFIDKNKDSSIVIDQKNSDYDILSGLTFDDDSDKEEALNSLGVSTLPRSISIYPKDFESKDSITSYLDKYNDNKDNKSVINYVDYAKTITSLTGSIMDAITVVLVGFSSISLVVSSIMIAIITYISVLERTKEIGILRSIGARKKDITRVFNAENFLIGLFSGLMGIGITLILSKPISHLLYNYTNLNNLASLKASHAIVMVIISIIVTLIGGAIPSKMASKKDPVIALRTE